nr:hypothetical protein Cplu_585 [Cedratvirus plubellavi]
MQPVKKEFPFTFTCSGELLWGQLHTLGYGYESEKRDEPASAEGGHTSGTIIQSDFNFRVAAKEGTWVVDKIAEITVFHHQDQSMKQVLQEVNNLQVDYVPFRPNPGSRLLYVNRYDWSGHYGNWQYELGQGLECYAYEEPEEGDIVSSAFTDLVGLWDEEKISKYIYNRLFLSSPQGFPLIKDYLKDKDLDDNALLQREGEDLGVVVCGDAEYDFAWMLFDQDKKKLIAFVYDPWMELGNDTCEELEEFLKD